MIKQLSKYGYYDTRLDEVLRAQAERISQLRINKDCCSFSLSEYGGEMDVLFDFPEAMARFDPSNPKQLHLDDFTDKWDLYQSISRDYRGSMDCIREKKFHQAVFRACEILEFIFKETKSIHILFQGPKRRLHTGFQVMRSCLKGAKKCSRIQPAPNLYIFEEELWFPDAIRMLYEHLWENFRVKKFVQNMIYGKMGLSEAMSDELSFYIISDEKEPVTVYVYDDQGMHVWADKSRLVALETQFSDWVRRLDENAE